MNAAYNYSADEFAALAHARFRTPDTATFGDHSFNPNLPDHFATIERTPAAVLVPVIDRGDEATVLLTQRSANLVAHSGQVAFPGGKIDRTDDSPEAAAIREAEEEIGLSRNHVELVARAPDYLTGSGYAITPVIARLRNEFSLALNYQEVDDAFEVPLAFLMNPDNHRRSGRLHAGAWRTYFEMPYGERYIWGVTANIVRILYCQLYAPDNQRTGE